MFIAIINSIIINSTRLNTEIHVTITCNFCLYYLRHLPQFALFITRVKFPSPSLSEFLYLHASLLALLPTSRARRPSFADLPQDGRGARSAPVVTARATAVSEWRFGVRSSDLGCRKSEYNIKTFDCFSPFSRRHRVAYPRIPASGNIQAPVCP